MIESVLLLLLTLGGGGSPAASPGLTPGATAPITGVWRGTLTPSGDRQPIPVEAVLAPGKQAGTVIGLVVYGAGRERRTSRLSGRYDSDGAQLALPSGVALQLSADGRGRLIGGVKGGGAAGFGPGDGALELTRVRR
jgi:hypothetical protein